MRETADIGSRPQPITLPKDIQEQFLETASALEARSTIVWGEHCSECAFPSCYGSCSFYAPRDDHHCRRFANGIEALRVPSAGLLNLSRIQFKRWGKLEGRGPAPLKAGFVADAFERIDRASYVPLRAPIPRALVNRAIWRLNKAKERVAASGQTITDEDAFLLEAWHQGKGVIPFTVTILPDPGYGGGLFQAKLDIAPGYNRIAVPTKAMKPLVDLSKPFRIQIEPVEEGTPPIVFGVKDFVRLARPFEAFAPKQEAARPKIKCVVWDLDNVVWQGTLLEDGIEGITINPMVVATIVELDRRGILNSVASKNDPDPTIQALKHFGLLDYFVFPQIGWLPKSDSIRQIAASLDIGLDTFAFVDDQAFERGEIQTLCPEVQVFSETQAGELPGLPRFDVPVTAESSQRRQMYKVEEHRQRELEQSSLNYDDFLLSSDIRLEVTPLTADTTLRVYELSQRTNQLNVSGRRYSRDEIKALMASGGTKWTYVLRCSDRFGDYGIIGFCVAGPAAGLVEAFFMSCRVQRKRVEHAFFALLSSELAARGHDTLRISHVRTAKNGAAVKMLVELGFTYDPIDENQGEFRRATKLDFEHSDIVTVRSVERVTS